MSLSVPFKGTAFPWRRAALETLIEVDDGQGLEAFLKKHPEAANWCKQFGKHNHSYLHEAALKGKPAVFRALLDAGAKTDGFSQWGDTLLEAALGMGRDAEECVPDVRERMARLLLENGVPTEQLNKLGHTAFLEACAQGNEYAARTLLSSGANPVVSAPNGMTPLMYVLQWQDKPQLMDMVLETKPDVNLQNKDGATALFYACTPAQVRVLIDAGANPNHVDKQSRVAGENPRRKGYPLNRDMVEYANIVDGVRAEEARTQMGEETAQAAHENVPVKPMKPLSLKK